MKTKTTRRSRLAMTIAAVLAATAALGNTPQENEAIYEEFARAGVFDPEVPTAKAKELVVQGLFNSPTPRVELLTLQALAGSVMHRMWPGVVVSGVVDRRFEEIPQLRDYLIALWHKKVAEEGLPEPILPDGILDEDHILNSKYNLEAQVAATLPHWLLIPPILAMTFPGDAKVHDFLVEYYVPLVEAKDTLLPLFNGGRFKTPEADALRIAHLGPDVSHGIFVMATRGLAMSRPDGGIEVLIAALQANKGLSEREPFIVEAIASYGAEAIPLLDSAGLEHVSAKIVRMP